MVQMLSPWRSFSQKTGVLFQGFSGSGANDEAASSAAESASPGSGKKYKQQAFQQKELQNPSKMEYL